MNHSDRVLEDAVIEFAMNLSADHLGPSTKEAVRILLKDQLAIQIGVSQLPWSKQTKAYVDQRCRAGNSTVVADKATMDASNAAFINAIYGHGFEYDDIYSGSSGHPGCCVIPTALAVGEEVQASFGDVITAIVTGYEVYTRIGVLAHPDLLSRGWHPHPILANFGAAAVAAKLWHLDAEKTFDALAVAASHASGSTEYSSTGGSIKRVHAGIGVQNGIQAAGMARAGITGPRRFLTGNKGFFNTFVQKKLGPDAAELFAIDQPMRIEGNWLKPYCCCGGNHAYIDAMLQFRDRAKDIERVEVRIQPKANSIVGSRNANLYAPRNIVELQYSLTVQMALSLLGYGNGYRTHRDFLAGKLDLGADSDVVQMARRITLHEDPELDALYVSKFVADATVFLKNGKSEHVFVENSKGTPGNRMNESEFAEKLHELSFEIVGETRARGLFAAIDKFDMTAPIGTITNWLRV